MASCKTSCGHEGCFICFLSPTRPLRRRLGDSRLRFIASWNTVGRVAGRTRRQPVIASNVILARLLCGRLTHARRARPVAAEVGPRVADESTPVPHKDGSRLASRTRSLASGAGSARTADPALFPIRTVLIEWGDLARRGASGRACYRTGARAPHDERAIHDGFIP